MCGAAPGTGRLSYGPSLPCPHQPPPGHRCLTRLAEDFFSVSHSAATEYHSQSHTSHPSPPHAALWAVRGRLVIVRGILQRNVRRKLDSSLQLLCCLLRIVKRHPSCCPWPCLHPITVLVPIPSRPCPCLQPSRRMHMHSTEDTAPDIVCRD